jgi:signal transduction histidine kinase
MPVNPVLMDLRQICSDLIAEYRSAHPTRDIRTKIEGQLWGHWDADRLRKAISNLLGNAIQHSPAEAVVSLNVTGTETDIVLVVWNDGSTIPPGEMPNIFDPLIRGSSADHPAANRPGSIGLGLYIAREIIISHGGTIGATSTEKDGTAFTISLPRDYLLKSGSPILDSTHIETM